jgi:nitrite reductase/ring-hydroxylating ferredoxin subunit
VCPLHAWKIDVRTGAVERPREQARCVETYPVRVDGNVLSVGLPTPLAVERDGAAA